VADDALADYRRKRDFEQTPEPAGERAGQPVADEREPIDTGRFVVHQHDATRLHWDLRLELDGVLWSFAIPRCLPWDPKRNNLAVHTEDHPLEYLDFEGDIPEGSYGAGHMFIWDTGGYELLSRKEGKLVVRLHGDRHQAEGTYALFRTRSDRDWMIHRMDPPADPERRWPPEVVPPMQAEPATAAAVAEVADGDDWAWEVALQGLRVMVTLYAGHVDVHDAAGNLVNAALPDVRRIGRATGSVEAVLDAVVVGDDEHIARRLAKAPPSAKRAAEATPAKLVAFDLVWLDGHPRWDDPWDERRAALDALALDGPAWTASTAHVGDGLVLLDAARQHGAPGLIGKRRSSPYRPGKRTPDWRLVTLP
jgi:bifunctional non-homologous end joining protein LigD